MFYLIYITQVEKSDKMIGLWSISLLFCNDFNEFNSSGAQILDSIYHMAIKLFKNCIFGVITLRFCHIYAT